MDYKHEVILCIVNAGFSDAVMDAAREFGARGGTVIHARGTANVEAEKLFNIAIQPEKEIVMILVESAIKNDILHALYQKVGLQSEGRGIAFCLPVEDVVGLSAAVAKPAEEKVDEKKKEEKSDAESEPASAEVEAEATKEE